MEIKPQVEILMATYNGSKYLSEQLDSIVKQSYTNWHLTISDDKSNDDTIDIIDTYISKFPNKIRRIDSGIHFGNARDHFFWLMKQCDSDYVMLSDQDDVWLDNKIELSINELLRLEKQYGKGTPILVFTDQKVVDEELNVISVSLIKYQNVNPNNISYKSLLFSNCVTGASTIFNKALLKEVKRNINTKNIIMHDWWLAIAASKIGIVSYMNKQLNLYRQHSDNSVGAKDVESMNYILSKIYSLNDVKQTVANKKKQALEFKDNYIDYLNKEDILFLDCFTKKRSGFVFYIKNAKLINGLNRFIGFSILG